MSGFLERKRIRNLEGVKAKNLMIWTPCGEIVVDDPPTRKIRFKDIGCLTDMYPGEAFATCDRYILIAAACI
ncbi:hypothetical protein NL676_027152 [Syzygium grande]|nr:hypothetical protein NL676_027152 [Syzygium grande]